MKTATILPTRKIVPAGRGGIVMPKAGYEDVYTCVLYFSETAWLRYLISAEVPSYDQCVDDLNAHPGKWVCIGHNR